MKEVRENQVRESAEKAKPEKIELKLREEQEKTKKLRGKKAE